MLEYRRLLNAILTVARCQRVVTAIWQIHMEHVYMMVWQYLARHKKEFNCLIAWKDDAGFCQKFFLIFTTLLVSFRYNFSANQRSRCFPLRFTSLNFSFDKHSNINMSLKIISALFPENEYLQHHTLSKQWLNRNCLNS